MDVPGYSRDNIEVEVKDGLLSVSGHVEEEKIENNEKLHIDERISNSFKRVFQLPKHTKPEASAKLKDGILSVSVPKGKETKRLIIDIDED